MMNWKGYGKPWHVLKVAYYQSVCTEVLSKTTTNLSIDCLRTGIGTPGRRVLTVEGYLEDSYTGLEILLSVKNIFSMRSLTALQLDGWSLIPGRGVRNFLFVTTSRMAEH
jgi:hypothetical protein